MKLSRALDLFRNRLSSSVSCRAASRRRATRTAPKLSRCEPLQSRILPVVTTFADGVLTVEFDEQNEQQLIFTTGAETGELLLNGESLVASSDEVESLIIQPQPESGGEDAMIGLAGDDKFFGGGDNDLIIGGAGIDTLNGNSHADRMAGRGNVIGSFGIEDTGNTNADVGDILNLDGLDEVVETVTYSFQWLEA